MSRKLVRPLILALAALVAACGDDGPTDPGLDPRIFELTVVSGGSQTGIAGTVLGEPLVVRVRNRQTGAAEDGARVSWQVVQGAAEVTRSSSPTDDNGLARTRVRLGNAAGAVTVRATVAGLDPVNFSGLNALATPTIQSLSVAQADPGDTIEVRVNDLPASMTALVLFDGVEGVMASRVDGAPAVLRTVVPPPAGVCSATVDPVDVRVRVGGTTTAAASLNVTVPANPFQVGQVLVIEGTTDVQCALLPADGGAAKYLLVALSAQFEQTGSFQVTLGANNVAFREAGTTPPAMEASFDTRLRAFERRLASRVIAPAQPPAAPVGQLFAGPEVGDKKQFWVLNDVDATTDTVLTDDEFDRITATLKFVGVNSLLYIDDAAPATGLTDADIEFLGELYDRRLLDVDLDFFGEPTDVDNNGQVIVLLSPTVNKLTPRGAAGVIVGFFFGLDLFPPNAANCPECRFSNGAELFYGLVPDPSGQFSDARTRERALELLPGVMVHETQHMINFRYEVFENSPPQLERLWLSEGMAHMAEELAGDFIFDSGDPSLADDLYDSNFGRALRYLQEPESASLTADEGQGSLGERGGWWLFLRWIGDQYGDFIFRDMSQAGPDGVANVELQTSESMFRLFADFAVAIWADDQTIPGLSQRYQIPKWQLRSLLRVDQGGQPVYALQPRQETFASFRNNQISQFLAGSSPFYVELDAAGQSADLQLNLTAATNAGLAILRYE